MSKEKVQGKIGVQSDNMFPIIKKFLYSDNEIFLREIVSNGVDAIQKLKTLAGKGEYDGTLGDLRVEVKIDGDKLIISDNGIGMSATEIEKYINQIAISGAEEFVDKYKDDAANIIGHFGLGFYSSFMVAHKVEIYTQSYRSEEASMRWSCEGSPEFEMHEDDKRSRGTDIILHIDEESKDFLEPTKIRQLLDKYCKFLPIPVVFGKEKEWKDGAEVDTDKDLVINDQPAIWTKNPSDLKDEDYTDFYQNLYPMAEEPLFWIHLNIDYPFNLTGILYFPKVKNNIDLQKNKIQLYSNQVFVTDSVEGIVPDFLVLLHGVLDSPDIPLNVSRSYLQADHNVKKISSYITRKVADKLNELFKEDRARFEEKWEAFELFVKYGMLTDEKFEERIRKNLLLKNAEDKHFTLDEYRELVAANQTDKEGNVVYLYAVDKTNQYSYIKRAEEYGYDVMLMDSQLDIHLISMLEQKLAQTKFVRVDSDTVVNLIRKDEESDKAPELSAEDASVLKLLFETQLPKIEDDKREVMLTVDLSHQGKASNPLTIVQGEFMRRMKDMSALQPNAGMYGSFPDSYTININSDHEQLLGLLEQFKKSDLSQTYQTAEADKKGYDARLDMIRQQLREGKDLDDATKETLRKDQEETLDKVRELEDQMKHTVSDFAKEHPIVAQLIDLGLLSSGLLKGAAMDGFIQRSMSMVFKK